MTPTADNTAAPRPDSGRSPATPRRRPQLICAALLVALLAALAPPRVRAEPAIPPGVWLMDGEVAVEIFDCGILLCGRVLWLLVPRDPQGALNLDKHNPDPTLRWRGVCGMTILLGLRQTGPDRWGGGRFYNPDDGKTYNVTMQLKSDDVIEARIYSGIPLFGKTKTLRRVPYGISEGWC